MFAIYNRYPLGAVRVKDENRTEKSDSSSTKDRKGLYEKTFLNDKSCVTAGCEGGFMKLTTAAKSSTSNFQRKISVSECLLHQWSLR